MQPEGGMAPPASGAVPKQQKLITGDLDMSLSSLVDNLNIKGPPKYVFLYAYIECVIMFTCFC